MTRYRRSKLNEQTMETIERQKDDYYKRRWKFNPKCKYIKEVQEIEKEKKLNNNADD